MSKDGNKNGVDFADQSQYVVVKMPQVNFCYNQYLFITKKGPNPSYSITN